MPNEITKTTTEAREYFKSKGLRYSDITHNRFERLKGFINQELQYHVHFPMDIDKRHSKAKFEGEKFILRGLTPQDFPNRPCEHTPEQDCFGLLPNPP